MTLAPGGLALAAALLAAAAMGVAIQRGGTCAVAAVDEWLTQRRVRRALAMAEAAAWVAGVLLLAHLAGGLPALPVGHRVTPWAVAGGVLLGLGAWLNQACMIGTVARVGGGDVAYLATPVGYFAGSATAPAVFAMPILGAAAGPSLLMAAPAWVAPIAVLAALGRVVWGLRQRRRHLAYDGAPHAATAFIGVAFAALLLIVGPWAYTDVLAEIADGGMDSISPRAMLAAALLAGAVGAGWLGRLWRPVPPRFTALLRCAAGGLLMGWGGRLVPGGNDALVLLGLPLAWPSAWVAVPTMVVTIALAQRLSRRRRV